MIAILGVVILVIAGFAVFAIAAGAIGLEARRLDATPPRKSFVLDDAVAFIADRLPPEITAQLAYDDVRRIVVAHLESVESRGIVFGSAARSDDDIVVDDDIVGDVRKTLQASPGAAVSTTEIQVVLDELLGYYVAIGAVGPPANHSGDEGVETA